MEPNNVVPETSDDAIDTVQERNTTTGRSYECTFCKRGFTNAQALGGHMNIHRKHKAKLKESSFSPPPNSTTTAATAINPFSISTQGKNKPLPLFGDGSSDSRNIRQENATKDDPPSPASEVDLELRLGHVESRENKINATRKFF